MSECPLTGVDERRCRCIHCRVASDVDALIDEDALGFWDGLDTEELDFDDLDEDL